MKIILSLAGLLAVAVSLVIAFQAPFGLWHWLFLLLAAACLLAARRVG